MEESPEAHRPHGLASTAAHNKEESLSQTRWEERTCTRGCPLTSTLTLALTHIRAQNLYSEKNVYIHVDEGKSDFFVSEKGKPSLEMFYYFRVSSHTGMLELFPSHTLEHSSLGHGHG